MSERNSIETKLGIQEHDIESIKATVEKIDAKVDGLQLFLNKLYEVFVTHKELSDYKVAVEKEMKEMREQIKELQKDNRKLVVRSAFISGIGFVAVMFKDIIVETIINTFKGRL
jgi:uncharacterized coiled-coil protein SlyX